MIHRFLFWLTQWLPCRLIGRENKPYLERYYVFSSKKIGISIYLHRFVNSDGDATVHNHPWPAVALCLTGGYNEERVKKLCVRTGWISKDRKIRPGMLNLIGANSFHRIQWIKPNSWTLFIHRNYSKDKDRAGWGFLNFVPSESNQTSPYGKVEIEQHYELTHGKQWWKDVPTGKHQRRCDVDYPRN